MLNDTDHDPTPPSGPMPGRLSMEERVRRSEMLEQATRQREAHALDKAAWTKGWKRRDEYLAELIARLTREAGTGIDEGAQLSIPGTDTLPPATETAELLSGRWAELVKISPPRIVAWTLKEADLSPVAKKLLERLKPKETLGKPASVTLEMGDLPELLDCTAVESLDAVAELLCFDLATLRGGKNLSGTHIEADVLRADNWRDDDERGPGYSVLREMLRTELDDVHPDCLLLGTRLPRRALLPLMEGLAALGAVTSTKTGWQRVARVPLWEGLVLEALARAKGRRHRAEQALAGCIDFDWTFGGLVEAGAIKKASTSEVTGQTWELVPEADRQPLSLDDVKAMVKRKAPKEGSKEAASLQRIADDLDLQAPTVRRACEALVKDGYLAQTKVPGGYAAETYFGPWYTRAKTNKVKAKVPSGKTKGKKGTPAKPSLRQEARQRKKTAATAAVGSAQDRTDALFPGVTPAPAREEEVA